MKATLIRTHYENLAKNIRTFWFKPEKPIDHIAGQFIEMTIPHKHPDTRGIKHWFTLSSSPTDTPLVSITTKFTNPSSSFKTALGALRPGDKVSISDPMGDFVLPKDTTIPLLFVAGGIGITPFHSIIKWLHDTAQSRDVTCIYAVNNPHEMIFQDLFEHYGMHRIIIVNKPQGTWKGETGQLTGQRILELAKPATGSLIYISGPEPMVETLNKELELLGTPKDLLIGDFFPGYTVL